MKINTKTARKGFTLVELLVVMAIIAVLASIATPLILNKRKDADRTKAVGHANQINLGMLTFLEDHGIRPGEVASENIPGSAAASANDAFKQMLLGTRSIRTEAIFFAPSLVSSTPDDDIGTVEDDFANALEERECGFVYVDAPDSRSGAPLAGAPLIDNTQELFDFDAYNGKAVFLKTDGSVVTVNINETSEEAEIIVGGTAVNILDGVANPTFREAPSILFPL